MWNCESVQGAGTACSTSIAPDSKIRIALIDRRALDRECLANGLLASRPELEISAFSSLDEWKPGTSSQDGIDVAILSIGGQVASDEAVARALERLERDFASIPTIILADSEAATHVLMALDRGVRGYIPSSSGLRVVVEIVNLVRAGGIYVPATSLIASREEILAPEIETATDPLDALLTPRQAAVAEALRQGKANKIIAYELELSESTVKVHIRAIMRKLQANNRTEVAFKLSGLAAKGQATARLHSLPTHRDRALGGHPAQGEMAPSRAQATAYG